MPGFVYCFTGYPGSGKSELLYWLSVLRAKEKNIKVAGYFPEIKRKELIHTLIAMYLGQNVNKGMKYYIQCSYDDYKIGKQWVHEHFTFLEYDVMPSCQTILDDYQDMVKEGHTMFITDPFNYVAEGSFEDGRGISMYLKTALSHMKTFAQKNNVINVIVEHPKQPQSSKDGEYPKVNQFMINGGAMWNNKMDCIVGVTVEFKEAQNIFETLKMKSQKYNGVRGAEKLKYDVITGRYSGVIEEKEEEIVIDLSGNGKSNEEDDEMPF